MVPFASRRPQWGPTHMPRPCSHVAQPADQRDGITLDAVHGAGPVRIPRSTAAELLRTALSLIPPGARSRIFKRLVSAWYELLSSWDKNSDLTLMNYGYAKTDQLDSGLRLFPEDEKDRLSLQLYHHVAGAIDLHGKDVLEVGCGRGGGSSFIMRYRLPQRLFAIDLAKSSVEFCARRYRLEQIFFSNADAEHIPFKTCSFDAVVNVESSHWYPSMDVFLQEVRRVLRPGGYFLFADIRRLDSVPLLRDQIRRSGLLVLQEEQITANVFRALELDAERKSALMTKVAPKYLPRLLYGLAYGFAGLPGSPIFERFRTGASQYLRFVMQKQWSG